MTRYTLNDSKVESKSPPGTALADSIRNEFHQKGTKIACREGDCGACTVLVGKCKDKEVRYHSVTSCIFPLYKAQDCHIITIDSLVDFPNHPLLAFFAEQGASQCGYCSPGFIMGIMGALINLPTITAKGIEEYIDGNICRCTGYQAIKNAVVKIAEFTQDHCSSTPDNRISTLIELGFLPQSFKYIELSKHEPTSCVDTTNGNAQILGGGSDLLVQKPHVVARQGFKPKPFVREQKNQIQEDAEGIWILANCTVEEFRNAGPIQQLFPNLHYDLRLFASTPIRNVATLAGNIVNASPIADMVSILLVLRTVLELKNTDNKVRIIPLAQFYKSYKQTALNPGEWIDRIFFPFPQSGSQLFFEKVSKRRILDIASVNSAALVCIQGNRIVDIEISAGGVAATPLLLQKLSAYLRGKMLGADLVKEACARTLLEISPISDVRGSKEYKQTLLTHLVRAHFLKLGVAGSFPVAPDRDPDFSISRDPIDKLGAAPTFFD